MKTLIIGASTNPERYSYKAAKNLLTHQHEIVLLGLKEGELDGHKILSGFPVLQDIDTITLYVGPSNQTVYYDYILSLKPRRVIFNPGTENSEFQDLLAKNGIMPEVACTLVLLSTGQYEM